MMILDSGLLFGPPCIFSRAVLQNSDRRMGHPAAESLLLLCLPICDNWTIKIDKIMLCTVHSGDVHWEAQYNMGPRAIHRQLLHSHRYHTSIGSFADCNATYRLLYI